MQGAKTSISLLPCWRCVHVHKSARFKTTFEQFYTLTHFRPSKSALFLSQIDPQIGFEDMSNKIMKKWAKGCPEAPERESKVAQKRRKGAQGAAGTALKLALFVFFFRSPTPKRPHDLPKPSHGSKNLPKVFP